MRAQQQCSTPVTEPTARHMPEYRAIGNSKGLEFWSLVTLRASTFLQV